MTVENIKRQNNIRNIEAGKYIENITIIGWDYWTLRN